MEILKDKVVYSNNNLQLSKIAMEAMLEKLNKHSTFICYGYEYKRKEGEIAGQTKEGTAYIINDKIYADVFVEEKFINNYNYDYAIIQEYDNLESVNPQTIKISAIYVN